MKLVECLVSYLITIWIFLSVCVCGGGGGGGGSFRPGWVRQSFTMIKKSVNCKIEGSGPLVPPPPLHPRKGVRRIRRNFVAIGFATVRHVAL